MRFCTTGSAAHGHQTDTMGGPRSCFFYLLCVSLGARVAGVLFEVFLRKAVEGECSNGAVQTRRCHPPCTAGAAPAVEIVAVDPNEALVHRNLPFWDCVPNPLPMGYHVVVLTLEGNLPQIPKRAKYQRCISTLSTERPYSRCVDANLRADNAQGWVVLKMQRFSTSREELRWCLWALASIPRWLPWWGGQAT